jgi:hypothetical protein
MDFWIKFLLVIMSMCLADISWTFYFITVEERNSLKAGAWSSLIICFGAFTAINYVEDRRLMVAAVIGAFLGTYLTVEYKKRK